MDVKNEMSLPNPAPAAPGAPAASGNGAVPSAVQAGKGETARPSADEPVQKVLREALNVEPVANRELRIEFEKDLHVIVVKVLDKGSGEVVRQIPMPESLALAKRIRAQMNRMAGDQSGIAVNREV